MGQKRKKLKSIDEIDFRRTKWILRGLLLLLCGGDGVFCGIFLCFVLFCF
jgi:hypothetical protein